MRAWKRALAAAGVRYRPPEMLRHTFASLLLSRNAPLLYVQRQGGWASAGILLRVYARWMPGEITGLVHPSAPQAHPVALAGGGAESPSALQVRDLAQHAESPAPRCRAPG